MSPVLLLLLAIAAQDEPRYKFSTTVYTFGTTVATNSGFRGDIYLLPEGAGRLPDFRKLQPVGSIYTPALCVPARSFDEGFPGVTERFEWFAIDYRGSFWVSEPGTYRFSLESDDGSILYIDDKRVIRNDGQHSTLEKDGHVGLKAGAHRIRVSYFQGPRFHVALVLQVQGPKDEQMRVMSLDEFKPPRGAELR
jgi:hypothetical protein